MTKYPTLPLTEIKEHPNNPRQHTEEQIKKIARSIKELGWGKPLIISSDNFILAGHGAYRAARDILGYTTAPIKQMKHTHDSPEALAYMVADNKLTDESDWNYGDLELVFEDLKLEGFEVELTGFDVEEQLEVETKTQGKIEVEEDDFDPESVEESIVQPGDIWQLGNHRLMCGDSTNQNDIKTLMNNETVEMVFTDPPYDFDKDDLIPKIIDLVTLNSHIFIMHDDKGIVNYLRNSDFEFKRFFVLDTKIASPRGNDPYLRHIMVSHEQKGDPIKHQNHHDGLSSIIPIDYRKNLKDERVHKHQKAIKDISKFIIHYSLKGHKVLDIFGGSGSTLIACEQLQRKCYMMELEPHNCDIIITRWEEFTGEKAKKINN